MSEEVDPCDVPPIGWTCSRGKGHLGPCAARQAAPWEPNSGGCFGHCDREGFYAPCRSERSRIPAPPSRKAIAELAAAFDEFEGKFGAATFGWTRRIRAAVRAVLALLGSTPEPEGER